MLVELLAVGTPEDLKIKMNSTSTSLYRNWNVFLLDCWLLIALLYHLQLFRLQTQTGRSHFQAAVVICKKMSQIIVLWERPHTWEQSCLVYIRNICSFVQFALIIIFMSLHVTSWSLYSGC